MVSPTEPDLAAVNAMAARGTAAWLSGLGLVRATATLSTSARDTPIPLPGLDEIDAMLADGPIDLVHAADVVLSTVNRESELSFGEVTDQVEICRRRAEDVERAVRAAAQLALGVTSQCFGTDEVMLLERAAVNFLHQAAVRAADDRHALHTLEAAGVRTEVAGLLARILAETGAAASWRGPDDDQWVEAFANLDADLHVSVPSRPGLRWSAPVTIAEPAEMIAGNIACWQLAPEEVDVTVVTL
jgi:hypothetical protein